MIINQLQNLEIRSKMKKIQIAYGCLVCLFGLLFGLGITIGTIPELSYVFLLPLGMAIWGLYAESKKPMLPFGETK